MGLEGGEEAPWGGEIYPFEGLFGARYGHRKGKDQKDETK